MTETRPLTAQRLFTSMRFVDAHAGIAFLQRAFGFEPQAVYDDGAGGVAHAQLVLQGQIIMLGSSRDDQYPVRSPIEAGAVTGGLYVALDDAAAVDAMHERARAAGAEILMPPHDTDYGSHDFLARDPEGHLFSFGTYRPDAP
ncbi:MAG TPA: VOC family protein [Candidatus Elarobacter sp.]|jgi:uncharacterized glyoxalase superfamily protein PhnB